MELSSHLADWAQFAGRLMEVTGIGVIIAGAAAATALFLANARRGFDSAYRTYREHLGRAILLGLEFLVAADIIGTVAIEASFENLGVLAGIVAIRTFLSFALEVEISGRWPWQSPHKR